MGDSWSKAYGIIADNRAKGIKALTQETLAEAEFRKQVAQSPILPKYSGEELKPDTRDVGEKVGDAAKSIGSRLIDALSVAPYMLNNIVNDAHEGMFESDNAAEALIKTIGSPVTGIAKGAGGAFLNMDEYKRTGSDSVKQIQEIIAPNTDSESETSKNVQAGVGLASDIFLDPTTYLTLGIAPIAKGVVTGAVRGGKSAAKKVEKSVEEARAKGMTEDQINMQIRDTKVARDVADFKNPIDGALKAGSREYKSFREAEAARKAAKAENKAFKKSGREAEEITPELLETDVAGANIPRSPTSFVAGADGVEVPSGGVKPTSTPRPAWNPSRGGEAADTPVPPRTEGVQVPTDDAIPMQGTKPDTDGKDAVIVDDKNAAKNAEKNASLADRLVDAVQGKPVSVGTESKGAKADVTAKLAETLAPSRAQEISDILGNIKPKSPRYKRTVTSNIRKEYEKRPSTLKKRVPVGKRSEQPEYVAPQANKSQGKERDTRIVSGDRYVNPEKFIEVLSKMPSNRQIALLDGKSVYAPQILKGIRGAYAAKDYDALQRMIDRVNPAWFKGRAAGESATEKVSKKSVDEEVDEILPDNPDEMIYREEEIPNPEAVTEAELVEKYGISPEDATRLLDEIEELVDDVDISGKLTHDTINKTVAYVKGNHISKEEFDLLAQLTGKETKAAVAAEVRAILNAHKAEINSIRVPSSKGKSPKAEKTEAQLAEQAETVTKLAEEFTTSPTALNAAVGKERLVKEYDRTVQEIRSMDIPDPEGVIRMADNAVQAMHDYQSKIGAAKSGRGFDVNKPKNADEAWMRGSYGSHAMVTLHNNIFRGVKELNGNIPFTQMNTNVRMRDYMNILKVADAKMRAVGIQPYASFSASTDKAARGVNLSLHDVLTSLNSADLRRFMFLGGAKKEDSFDVTQIMGAVETLMRGKAAGMNTDDLVKEIADWIKKPQSKAGLGKKLQESRKTGVELKKDKEKLATIADKFARGLVNSDVYSNLSYRMLINSAQHATRVGEHVADLTEPAIARITSANNATDFMKAMDDEMAALKKEFTPEEWEMAQLKLESDVQAAMALSTSERQLMDFTSKVHNTTKSKPAAEKANLENMSKPGPDGKPNHTKNGKEKPAPEPAPKVVNDSRQAQAKAAEEEIRAIAPADADEFEIIGASIAADMVRKVHPIKSFFVPSLGIQGEGIYRAMNTGLHTVAHLQNNFHEQLLKHLSKYGSAQLTRDFKEMQQIVANTTDRVSFTTQSQNDLWQTINTMFAISGKSVFEAQGVGVAHFNNLATAAKLNPNWRFSHKLSRNENVKLWTQWEDIENVPDFLSRMHNVAVRASQDIAIAASFTNKFGSVTKKPGYVKINKVHGDDGQTGLFELINKDMYYPIEIARDFGIADRLLKESRSVSGKGFMGKFVINIMDPVTNALKASQTTVRPGHWVLSIAGDTLRNQMAGVNSITPYKQAIKVLKAAGHDMSEVGPIERYRAVATSLRSPMVEGHTKGVTVNINGKHVNISNESLARIFQQVIELPPHSGGVMEDVLEATPTMRIGEGLKKATDFVTNNEKFSLNKYASIRDNWMRTTLALDFIQKGKFKSVEEMKAAVEEHVTKWAPTSTDFGAAEAKYARRSFLYYTWLRGITPRVIETMLNRPGATTWMSKAQYAVAQANGLEPESFGSPFPEDGHYPDYYRNSVLGPQWKDDMGGQWGINPSHPAIEVTNSFGAGSIGAGLLGMATPFAKMPLEMIQGRQTSGVPIEDNAQYLLDNLGGSYISTLSRATGKTINENGIVDRTDSAHKSSPEEQMEHAKLQGINFFTGAQLKDFQSDSARKSAKWDHQERMKREKEEEARKW